MSFYCYERNFLTFFIIVFSFPFGGIFIELRVKVSKAVSSVVQCNEDEVRARKKDGITDIGLYQQGTLYAAKYIAINVVNEQDFLNSKIAVKRYVFVFPLLAIQSTCKLKGDNSASVSDCKCCDYLTKRLIL